MAKININYISIGANFATIIAVFVSAFAIWNSSKSTKIIHTRSAYIDSLKVNIQSTIKAYENLSIICPLTTVKLEAKLNEDISAMFLWDDIDRFRKQRERVLKLTGEYYSIITIIPHYKPERCITSATLEQLRYRQKNAKGTDYVAQVFSDNNISYTTPKYPIGYSGNSLISTYWLDPDKRDNAISQTEDTFNSGGKKNE